MELKVKTLDGGDHVFAIDDQASLLSLRESIASRTGVAIANQRLIFQGRVLGDNERSLHSLGLRAGHTLHMVERAPNVSPRAGASGGPSNSDGARDGSDPTPPGIRNRNVVVGNLPVHRLPTFTTAHVTELVQSVLARIGGRIGRSGTVRTEENVPHPGDLTVHLQLHGTRQTHVDSPARERITHITQQMRRVERMFAVIQHITIPSLELFAAVRRAGRDPSTMSDDDFGYPLFPDEDAALEAAVPGIAEATDATRGEREPSEQGGNSAAEERNVSGGHEYTMRHGTVRDLAQLYRDLMRLQERQLEIMRLFEPILSAEHTYSRNNSEGQVAGRLHNEMQAALHAFAHVLHVVSDLNMHLCESPPRRLYPQYSHFELDEPTEADITLSFSPTARATRPMPHPSMTMRAPFRHPPPMQPQARQMPFGSGASGGNAPPPPARGFFPVVDASRNVAGGAAAGGGMRFRPPGVAGMMPPMGMRIPGVAAGSQPPPFLPLHHPMARLFSPHGVRQQTNVRMQIGPNGEVRVEGSGFPATPFFAAHQPPNTAANAAGNAQGPAAGDGVPPPPAPAPAGMPQGGANPLQNLFANILQAAVGGIFGGGGNHNQQGQSQNNTPANGNTVMGQAGGGGVEQAMPATAGPSVSPLAHTQIRITDASGLQEQRGAFSAAMPRSSSAAGHVANAAGGQSGDDAHAAHSHQRMQDAAAATVAAVAQAAATAFGGQAMLPPHGHPMQAQPPHLVMPGGHGGGAPPTQGAVGGRVFVGRNSIPWQQTGLHPANQHAAVFIGSRPPSELPLFTTDPFLPCPSRHFDIRESLHRTGNQTSVASQATGSQVEDGQTDSPAGGDRRVPTSISPGADADAAVRAASAGQIRVNRHGQAIFDSDAEFTAFLEHILRSVINNMSETDPEVLRDVQRPGDQPRRVYAFQPLSPGFPVITGTISMEAGPAHPDDNRGGQPETTEATLTFVTAEVTDDDDHAGDPESMELDTEMGAVGHETNPHGTSTASTGGQLAAMIARLLQQLQTGGNMPLRQFMRGFGEQDVVIGRDRGMGNMVVAALTETLGVQDVVAIFNGDVTAIDRIRPQLRRFFCQHVLNDNSRPSAEDLHSATGRLTSSREDFTRMLSVDGANLTPEIAVDVDGVTRRRVDLVETAINIEETAIERALRLIFGIDLPAEGETIGQSLIATLSLFARQMVVVGNLAMGTGNHGYETILRRYLEQQMAEAGDMIAWLDVGVTRMRQMMESGGLLTVEDIRGMLAWAPEEIPGETNASGDGRVQADAGEQVGEQIAISPLQTSDSACSLLSSSSDATVTADEGGNVASASSGERTDTPRAPHNAAARSGIAEADQAWKRVLPPDWVAVIENDVEKQRLSSDETQPPFSDAYMLGMPPKRRKMVVAKNATADDVLRNTLRHTLVTAINESGSDGVIGGGASETAAVLGDLDAVPLELLDAFGAELDEGIRERLRTDPDYDPEKFPAIAEYFKS